MAKRKELFDPSVQTPWDATFAAVEAKYPELPSGLLKHVAWTESRFDPQAKSPVGAVGIAQFMPATAKQYGLTDRTDPVASIEAMGKMLNDLGKHYKGNYAAAVAAYNGGWRQGDAVAAGRTPPAKETQNYVKELSATIHKTPDAMGAPKMASLTPLQEDPERFSPNGGPGNIYGVPPAAEREAQRVSDERAAADRYSGVGGSVQWIKDAFTTNNTAATLGDTWGGAGPYDANWRANQADIQKDSDEFGPDEAQWMERTALNQDHYESLRELKRKHREIQDSMATQNGIANFVVNAAAVMTSPESLATLPIGGAAGGLTKAGSLWNASRAARVLDVGLTQGLLNVAGDSILEESSGIEQDPTLSFVAGAGLGALSGALSRPATSTIAAKYQRELDDIGDRLDLDLTTRSMEENGAEFTERGKEILGRTQGPLPVRDFVDEAAVPLGAADSYTRPLAEPGEEAFGSAPPRFVDDGARSHIDSALQTEADRGFVQDYQALRQNGKIAELGSVTEAAKASELVRSGHLQLDPAAKAVYIPQEDIVLMFRDNITPQDNIRGLVLHEVGVHMSLERYLGTERMDKLLGEFNALREKDPAVRDAFKRAEAAGAAPHIRDEEALGYFMEATAKRQRHPLIKDLVYGIREWFRSRGWANLSLTAGDLDFLLRRSVADMAKNPSKSMDLMFPYVWHGSPTKGIEELDLKYLGTGEGRQSFGFGHYVSSEKGTALDYRNKESIRRGKTPDEGGLYRLKLAGKSPDEYLAWEATKQSPQVEARLAPLREEFGELSGGDLYRAVSERLGGDKAASEFLEALGIPGIRMETGRTRGRAATNSNYVVFSNKGVSMDVRYSKSSPLAETAAEALVEAGNSRAALSRWRFDADARVNGSVVQSLRKLGAKLMPSPAGKENRLEVQGQTALDSKEALQESWQMRINAAMANHWTSYSKDQQLPSRLLSNKADEVFEQWSDEVVSFIQDKRPDAVQYYHPSVVSMAGEIRKVLGDATEYINDPEKVLGKSGSEGLMASVLEQNPHYFPKTPNIGKMQRLIGRLGYSGALKAVEDLVYQSRRALGMDAVLKADHDHRLFVAKKEHDAAQRGRANPEPFDMASVPRVPEGLSDEMYFDMLCKSEAVSYAKTWVDANGANISKTDFDSIHKGMGDRNLNHRLELEEGTTIKLPDGSEFGWKDLTERNFQQVLSGYFGRMSGRIALAAHAGVRADEDWSALVKEVREDALSNNIGKDGYTAHQLDYELQYLQFAHDSLLSIPQHAPSRTDSFLRMARDAIYAARSGFFAFNQLGEFNGLMGRYGLSVTKQMVPEFRKFLIDAKTGKVSDADAHFMMETIGDVGDDTKWLTFGSRSEWVDSFGDSGMNRALDSTHNVIKKAGTAVSKMSGFAYLNAAMRRMSYKGAHLSFAQMAAGGAHKAAVFSPEQRAWAGLDDAMFNRLTDHIRAFTTMDQGRYKSFDWEGFQKTDPEAFHAYLTFIKRNGDAALQRNSFNTASIFMGSPLGKVLFQFRQFLMHAWARQTMRSIHYRDSIAGASFLYGTMLSAMLWTARVHISAAGRDDAQEYRDKMLSPEIFAGTVLSRVPQMSMFPTIVDTVSPWGPVFGGYGRTSVTQSPDAMSFFTGNPMVDFSKNIFNSAKVPIKAMTDDEFQMNQSYVRNTSNLMFGSSLPYVIPLLNQVTEMFPDSSEQDD